MNMQTFLFLKQIVNYIAFCLTGLVEEGYHDNPYHNAIHAADVAQAMHCYIMQEKVILIIIMPIGFTG